MNVGEVISHKYEVLAPLEQDNLGRVYKARHVVLNTIFALKVLPREIIANPDAATGVHSKTKSLTTISGKLVKEQEHISRFHLPHFRPNRGEKLLYSCY